MISRRCVVTREKDAASDTVISLHEKRCAKAWVIFSLIMTSLLKQREQPKIEIMKLAGNMEFMWQRIGVDASHF